MTRDIGDEMIDQYELDFLPVGDGEKSGDAIAAKFRHPLTGEPVVVIIDAGFKKNGEALVEHIKDHYGTDAVDLAILTHPDGDHIGGMGEVLRGLNVRELLVYDLAGHGASALSAASAVTELIDLAKSLGTTVSERWAGHQYFGGALTILGPSWEYFDELLIEQIEESARSTGPVATLVEVAKSLYARATEALPVEVPFEPGEVNPRNNSSIITMLTLGERTLLLTADAGVPALDRAWSQAEVMGIARRPTFLQVPHHGSRRNLSTAWLDRVIGMPTTSSGGTAFISVVKDAPKHPSAKVVNALIRRGFTVCVTAGKCICHSKDGQPRDGWGPTTPLGPMDESDED